MVLLMQVFWKCACSLLNLFAWCKCNLGVAFAPSDGNYQGMTLLQKPADVQMKPFKDVCKKNVSSMP